ncbi:myb family transcription factor PHL8-like, partial [Pistacia vera]|uniref:myb family transcription factor PHL8-like n=1 Tax=Pistacia vera TaxID=55513 RepID=UPI001263D958
FKCCVYRGLQIAQALQVQLEVQSKLHEQIEVRTTIKPIRDSFLIINKASSIQFKLQSNENLYFQVQRHLQLRIKAQVKYLQSVLKKAQETLAGYNSSPVGVELAKEELSQLVSMVNIGSLSSSVSELIEAGTSSLKDIKSKQMRNTICFVESSLTSSESFEAFAEGVVSFFLSVKYNKCG